VTPGLSVTVQQGTGRGFGAVPVKGSDGDAGGQDTGLATGPTCVLASQMTPPADGLVPPTVLGQLAE